MVIIKQRDNLKKLKYIERKIEIARKRLQQAWDLSGTTDDLVLKAGAEFDAVYNEYRRLVGEKGRQENRQKVIGKRQKPTVATKEIIDETI